MSLSEKWINSLFEVATGSKFRRNLMTPVGFIFFVSFVLALIFFAFFLDSALNFSSFVSRPLNLMIGLPLIAFGILLVCICVIYFIRSKGTPVPLNPPKKVIIGGPYAYSRNPMLTGLFLQLFGFGICTGSVSLTFIVTPVFVILNVIELKKIEEPELIKRFGQEYMEYRNKVPMFFPRFF
jgi:protein-S-isoprenylcysteine O-methyltransferase Ste14